MKQNRITNIEAISLYVPLKEKIDAPISIPHASVLADTIFSGYRTTLVRIQTEFGIEGVGECMVRLAPTATRDIIRDIAPMLIGRDVLDREALWELMYGTMMNRGHSRGFYTEAMSGLDIAIWDAAAKTLDVPLYKLVGGRHHEKLRAYASSIRFRDMDLVLAQARDYKTRGFKAIKIKIGRNLERPELDIDFVRAIREDVGDEMKLMVDANCAYGEDIGTALRVGRAMQDLDIYWFEEPLSPDNIDGNAALAAALDINIALGEADFMMYGAREFIAKKAVDIFQPNISRTGGITEARRIAALLQANHIPYAPHTGSCSAVCLAATLQFSVALPHFLMFEYMQSDWSKNQPNPLRHDLLKQPVEIFEDGFMVVPERPGIGVELNEDIVDNWRVA
ncbi:MAG: mandelate racemase/muconate lactonizing enzyme family protein [Alcaligenaceae bacterium]|nr:mandelate racemase/muconate lactonizing enzyme family protein [Alcaligenaceae bacterium SAGV5]MPS51192.1 mandelate racemase/muconate lactonizing enzyme family protein [Alcaligenaceae bacterium SAGV3]MPT57311.1 mandelate racemase/muconate lactonizing enzyme family protein [Alcaligenaceae bacterium]